MARSHCTGPGTGRDILPLIVPVPFSVLVPFPRSANEPLAVATTDRTID